MNIKILVTHYALRMADGVFHVFKKTQVLADSELEDMMYEYDDFKSADEAAKDLQRCYDERNKC
jgi:hypothetical protein